MTEPAPPPEPDPPSRRSFVFVAALGSLAALIAAAFGATFRFLVPSVLYEPPTSFSIGPPAKIPPDSVTFVPEHRLFVFNRPQGIQVLSSVCTHLGCNVRLAPGGHGFKCPCHGSTYDMLGNITDGPAPKPLVWYPVSLSRKGNLIVDTAVQVGPEYVLVLPEEKQV